MIASLVDHACRSATPRTSGCSGRRRLCAIGRSPPWSCSPRAAAASPNATAASRRSTGHRTRSTRSSRLYPDVADAAAIARGRAPRPRGDGAPLLCGVPLALKDLFAVAGLPLTASSRVLTDTSRQDSAVAWERLRDDGMVLVGHTHTHEFAAGGTTDQVGNPWDLTRSAGGSSGGLRRRARRRHGPGLRWAPTPPGRCASRRRCPGSARSSRRAGASRCAESCRSPPRSTTPGRWRARSPTAARCSPSSPAAAPSRLR